MHKFVVGASAPLFLAISVMAQTSASPAAKPATVPPMPTTSSAAKPGQPPVPAHPITTAQAHELMQETKTDQIKARLIDYIMASTQRFPPYVPADVKEDLHASLEKMDIEPSTVASYQRYLSTEDAEKIIEFYKTPAGKSLLTVTPFMMNEIQQNALKQGQDTLQSVIARHKPEIEAAQKTYQQDHPAPTLGPSTTTPSPSPAAPKKPQ